MTTLQQRIDAYLSNQTQKQNIKVSEAQSSIDLREREEIEMRTKQGSFDKLKWDMAKW